MKSLLSADEIRGAVERVAGEIHRDFGDRPLTIIGVMTGSIVFLADLIRMLSMPLRVGVVVARSYRGAATEPGAMSLNVDMLPPIAGCDVLVVDDIFDTGNTLLELLSELDTLQPASLRSAVLLLKQGRQRTGVRPDYVGFRIPDEFVVGYGLDFQDAYRNLPYIAALEPAEIAAGRREG